MTDGLPNSGFELIKELENGETASFYYGYDPRTSLAGEIYKEVLPLVRREDILHLIRQEVSDLYEELKIENRDSEKRKIQQRIIALEKLQEEVEGQ